MQLSLPQIGRAMQAVGDYEGCHDLVATRVQTDSRLVQPGDLFVCIQGERFDGHTFAREAVHKGALAVVVERPLMELTSEVPMLLVQSSLKALADLAALWRSLFSGQVVAVTGTAGKTTVKELVAAILEHKGRVGKNFKNWNNQLGVSLSILGMNGREDYWVLEAGISEQGEMDCLAAVLAPDVAVVVNVGPAHLQGLHSVAGVAREKAKLVQAVPGQGAAVVSRDYPELIQALPHTPDLQVITFSIQADGPAEAVLAPDPCGCGQVVCLNREGESLAVQVGQTPWIEENILAAVCTASLVGASPAAIRAGLDQARLPEHRGHVHTLGGFTLIDDCYNANPLSMRLALHRARARAGGKPLVLILGEMKELGTEAHRSHHELGALAAGVQADHLLYYGAYAPEVASGFTAEGQGSLHFFDNEEQFVGVWRDLEMESGLILVKGSRGCGLERFVHLLEQELQK